MGPAFTVPRTVILRRRDRDGEERASRDAGSVPWQEPGL